MLLWGYNIKIYKKFNLIFADENEENGETKDGIKKEGNSGCVGGAGGSIGSANIKLEKDATGNSIDKKDGQLGIKTEKEMKDAQRAKELKIVESEMVRDMKVQLKYVSVSLNLFLNCKILTFLFIFFFHNYNIQKSHE